MNIQENTIIEIKKEIVRRISSIYEENEANNIAFLLIEKLLGKSKIDISLQPNERISESEIVTIIHAIRRLEQNEPIQYVIGEAYFFDMIFKVNDSTLIPRPETEELIYLIKENHPNFEAILDIGTGSGCIPIALKKIYPKAKVTGLDISEKALDTARKNARTNNLEVDFYKTDILKKSIIGEFDLIISNPPYIKPSEKVQMRENVLKFEPETALFIPENDPLLFYRRIVDLCNDSLKKNGWLYFEINENHAEETLNLFQPEKWNNCEILMDFLGKPRFIKGQLTV